MSADQAVWQSNTRKLENAGAMGVEYSLSCPQGGDGTEGDIVSQNAELAAKIIDWVMEASAEDNPKLFKLTAAVTSIQPIIKRIQQVFAKCPNKKAGVTLANSFPSLVLRKAENRRWEEGVVVGMSGEGVLPISNLTLAKVSGMGIAVSGNGGPMNYKAAANFLALGAQTVQFCTIVMKYGLGIVDELHSGLSFLMEERGFKSVRELIGSALPNPITDFMALSATKKLPQVVAELCEHCGNCTRCPYQAITLNGKKVPLFDPALCIGCSLCARKCFAGAISMRPRTAERTGGPPSLAGHVPAHRERNSANRRQEACRLAQTIPSSSRTVTSLASLPKNRLKGFADKRIDATRKVVAARLHQCPHPFLQHLRARPHQDQASREFRRRCCKNLWWRLDSALTTEDCYYSALVRPARSHPARHDDAH